MERVGVHSVRLYGQKTVTDKADMDTFLNKMVSTPTLALIPARSRDCLFVCDTILKCKCSRDHLNHNVNFELYMQC